MPSSTVADATAHAHTTTPTTTTRRDRDSKPPEQPRRRNVFVRLYWMLFGSAVLFVLALTLLKGGHAATSATSLAMWGVAGSMVGARWLDITRFDGLTADGEPATVADLRRYAAWVLGGTAIVWGGVMALG